MYVSPAPGDYLRTNEAELTFGPTTDRIVYQIPIVRDDVLEAEENFAVQLSLPTTESGVVLGRASATVVVTDDNSKCMSLHQLTMNCMCAIANAIGVHTV